MVSIPRIVIAAPASGHGKTSVATGLLAAYRARGLRVSGHKVGPDYIDPSYHALAAGRPGRNLDPWLVGEERIRALFVHGAQTPVPAEIAVIEGVMGLFDGATARPGFASTAHVATLLSAPVVLVVDATGTGRSIAALLHGFASFDPAVRLGGVILNRVGSARHAQLLAEAVQEAGVPLLGTLPRAEALATPARHLGLIPAAERHPEATETVAALGSAVTAGVDLDALFRLARSAPPLPPGTDTLGALGQQDRPGPRPARIAVAAGAAFTFGYTEQVELLAGAGAEVVTLDPLRAETLPDDLDGLIIGGGFPETHAETLSANAGLRAQVAARVGAGLPVAAECAGLLYLGTALHGHPMCGVLDVTARMTPRLTLGYREAVATATNLLCAAGTRVHGHEFHRTTCTPPGGQPTAWQWRQAEDVITEGFATDTLHASYLHLHWAGIPGIADRFVAACLAGRARRAERVAP